MYVVLDVGREHGDMIVGDVRPQLELVLPLKDGDGVGAQDNYGLLYGLGGRDPREGLTGPAGKDDDPRSRASVPEHLRETDFIFVDIGAMVRCIIEGATIAMHKQEE
jgi:hypothetical protein